MTAGLAHPRVRAIVGALPSSALRWIKTPGEIRIRVAREQMTATARPVARLAAAEPKAGQLPACGASSARRRARCLRHEHRRSVQSAGGQVAESVVRTL